MKPQIAILFTGGTISMRVDPKTGGPVPALSGEEIIARVEGLNEIANIDVINFALLPGPHMTPPKMLELAHQAAAQLASDRIAGVVVTHGTDTLEETAYLHDLVLDSEKPVVFVGAMRNSSELSWDGPANLRAAVRVAVDPSARGLGVLIVMGDQIIAAAEATKTHTEAVDTFQSRDFGPLGIVDKDRIIVTRRPLRREHIAGAKVELPAATSKPHQEMGGSPPQISVELEQRVEIIKLAAGSDGRFINFAIDDGAKALVIEGLGRGNVPVAALPAIQRAITAGIPVVVTSRCPRGRVLDTYAYEGAGRQLKRMGAILGGMIPSHKARIKLMLLLGAGYSAEQIRASFEPY
ncbi:MAG: asparaginase [Verrucomicrobia bacterium]|nr:asparaginase [Verrucomicrobiota bacterium]